MGDHPVFTDLDVRGNHIFRLGPGLNAANMSQVGWLDTSRVWEPTAVGFEDTLTDVVALRPLHARDLTGHLAAKVGEFFVEFRVPERWDTGIGQPVVLIHELSLGHSYLHPALQHGGVFVSGDPTDPLGALTRIEVTDIDTATKTATLLVRVASERHRVEGPAEGLIGRGSDGGGLIIIGGQIHPVPPWSPLMTVLHNLVTVTAAPSGSAVQLEALQAIQAVAHTHIARLQ